MNSSSLCPFGCDSVCVQGRRHRSKLPRALRGLMGEANIRYARGDKEDAILMCMEIIRQGMSQPLCVYGDIQVNA